MQIIIVPEGIRKGVPTSLSSRHLMLIAFAGLVVVPILVGLLAYKLVEQYDRRFGDPAFAAYHAELRQSRNMLLKTREETTRHLNALAFKLGTMQAQVLRLNALGGRLTRMAGLDGREFNFDAAPGLGGPEKNTAASEPALDINHTIAALAHELERSQARLLAIENVILERKLDAAVTPAGWPVQGGWVSSGFGTRIDPFTGARSLHDGADIAAPLGGPVFAMGDGVVSYVGERSGYGTLVELTHESGLITRYGHLSATETRQGDRVTRGQLIARVGTSGRSTGPHLHFEVIRNGKAINPAAFLAAPSGIVASTLGGDGARPD